ncbi:MAG: hypothetical protein AB1776_03645, partial [Bacillota bacterium]
GWLPMFAALYLAGTVLCGAFVTLAGLSPEAGKPSFNWPTLVFQGLPALTLAVPEGLVTYFFGTAPPWHGVFGTHNPHAPALAGAWFGAVLVCSLLAGGRPKDSKEVLQAVGLNAALSVVILSGIYLYHQVWQYYRTAALKDVLQQQQLGWTAEQLLHQLPPLNTLLPGDILFGVLVALGIRGLKGVRWKPDYLRLAVQGLPALLLAIPPRWYALVGMPEDFCRHLFELYVSFPFTTLAGFWLGSLLVHSLSGKDYGSGRG